VNLLILPLEMMPALGFTGPINALVITSIVMNFLLTVVLQVYAARNVQVDSSKSVGAEAPT
jgi:multisubunit Na+/H+ antiporter MnhC subunit